MLVKSILWVICLQFKLYQMHRNFIVQFLYTLIIAGVFLAGCADSPAGDAGPLAVVSSPTEPPAPTNELVIEPTATSVVIIAPTATEAVATLPPPPTATAIPIEQPTEPPAATTVTTYGDDLSISAENVFIYPVPKLYTNDRVTFQVFAHVPDNIDVNELFVDIYVGGSLVVNNVNMGGYSNLNGDPIGLYQWAWQPEVAQDYTISVVIDPDNRITTGDENPDNNATQFDVTVHDSAQLPYVEQTAVWESYETEYAKIHLVSGTAAARDRDYLLATVDAAVLAAADILQVEPITDSKVEIYFIDRVIGQGGYAGSSMVISYPDRNYAGGGLYEVLVHESIHVLDQPIESDNRVTFLVEGLAVWGTGGHYKPEDLDARMAGLLLDTDRYIPLAQLVDNFYPAQHEVGYLEGGSFVKYLVDVYGYDLVRSLFSNTRSSEGTTPSAALSQDLIYYFGKTLEQMEADWHRYLQGVPRRAEDALDLNLTIEYYEIMREYQQAYDPTAYYLYAWLPYPEALREKGETAELSRHSDNPTNIAIEAMLESADIALRTGEYNRTRVLLDSVKRVLANGGQFIDPLAQSYFQLVQKSAELGFIAQDITLYDDTEGPKALITATDPTTNQPVTLTLALEGVEWTVVQ